MSLALGVGLELELAEQLGLALGLALAMKLGFASAQVLQPWWPQAQALQKGLWSLEVGPL